MNATKTAVVVALSAMLLQVSSADELDDAIAALRSGIVKTIDEEKRNELIKKSGDKEFKALAESSASLYAAQVKWAILNPDQHGGWPCRSFLLHGDLKSTVYKSLKTDYEKEPTPLKAYTLMCPAMAVGDDELVDELEKKIGGDKYFSGLLKKNLPGWKNFLASMKE